ncbi:MAG: hypothetical protein K2K35_03085, partial [Lachnospiraceae bacterium]|nr:hypothetical protein [Lachnospiraceae bacterium]
MNYKQILSIDKTLNVIIYGAGTLGRIVYNELLKNSNIKIVGWSDQKYNRINDAPIEIISPQNIKNFSCDVIILTLNNEKLENEVIVDLRKIGINA